MNNNNDSNTSHEVKPPGASMYLVGLASSAIFLFIVGTFNVSPAMCNVLGIVLFFITFGIIAKLNWEWYEPALDFDLEDLGFNGTPMFMKYSNVKNTDAQKAQNKTVNSNKKPE